MWGIIANVATSIGAYLVGKKVQEKKSNANNGTSNSLTGLNIDSSYITIGLASILIFLILRKERII
jgi:hypothetical protein